MKKEEEEKMNIPVAQAACAIDSCAAVTGVVGLVVGLVAGFAIGKAKRGGGQKGRKPSSAPKHVPSTPGAVEIYVGNLSYETDDERLRKEFEKYGTVASVRIVTNRFNDKSKGFGFVEMPVRSEAEAAIKALHDYELQGRKLRVNEARNK